MHDSDYDTADQSPPDKRMAGNYEIIHAMRIGDREVVFGRNDTLPEPYFCALCQTEQIAIYQRECYFPFTINADYIESMMQFSTYVQEQCDKVRVAQKEITVPLTPITPDMCHACDYSKSIEGKVVAVKGHAKIMTVLDAETVAAGLHCDVETDLNVIYARPDVDAVIVATPNYLHNEPVHTAARHGKAVFCEKPIALSYADCDEMVNVCEKARVMFMAGHVRNFFRSVRHAKQLIGEEKIYKVLYCHSARDGWDQPQPPISWKKVRSKSGGHLYHHIHELGCIQFIPGPATKVTMTGGNVAHSGPAFSDEDNMLFLTLELDNNTYGICEYG